MKVKNDSEMEVLEDDYHTEQDSLIKALMKRIATKQLLQLC